MEQMQEQNSILETAIDPTRPWAGWDECNLFTARLQAVDLAVAGGGHHLELRREDGEGGHETIGRANSHCLRELSTRVGFPVDFVMKLSDPELQARVINDRVRAARDQEFGFAVESGAVSNIMPSWRGVLPHRLVAQVVDNAVAEGVGGTPEVDMAATEPGGMRVRLLTMRQDPVTPKVGDVLRMGVEVVHRYGVELDVSLYAQRLVCTNGMVSSSRQFEWSRQLYGSREDQLHWVRLGVAEALTAYDDLVTKAREMASARFEGDWREALRERARALRIHERYMPALVEAFEQEGGGDTEWDLLNAITRFGTHGPDARLGRRLQRAGGSWVEDFDLVTARLPRPLATACGAHIIE
jgi:hypothetical protein